MLSFRANSDGATPVSFGSVKVRFVAGVRSLGLRPVPSLLAKSPSLPVRNGRRGVAGNQPDEGYILLAVLVMILMVMISLSVALPKMAADIERDREVETVHRGQQYVRAIKLYYKKFQAYPPNIEALEKSNNIRFLRRRYKDPMTGKAEWKLIHFGQNKTPSYGFFGQPISGAGGSVLAGTGPGGGVAAGTSFGAVSTSNFGGSSSGSSSGSLNGPGSGGPSFGGGSLGNTTNTSGGTDGSTTGTGSGTDTSGGTTNGTGIASAFGGSSSGQTFGGGGIIGVSSTSPKSSTIVWHKMKHFNEWEFWYDPNADRVMVSGNAGAIGTPASGAGNTGISSPSSFGGSTNSTVPPPNGGQITPQ
jgi:type II secretory pathway pseudopilin PulG